MVGVIGVCAPGIGIVCGPNFYGFRGIFLNDNRVRTVNGFCRFEAPTIPCVVADMVSIPFDLRNISISISGIDHVTGIFDEINAAVGIDVDIGNRIIPITTLSTAVISIATLSNLVVTIKVLLETGFY